MSPRLAVLPLALALTIAACAPKKPVLPTGPGTPSQDYQAPLAEASADCGHVKTLTAALNLSGRAGRTKLRGRIDAGFAAPSDIRLEGVAPFGKPVFVLVSRNERATLVLPRDERVLRDAPAASIVEALAGVPLGPAELRSIVAGCGLTMTAPSAGRTYAGGWIAVDAGETTAYLRQVEGRWRVAGATRGAITVSYADFTGSRAATVRVQTTPSAGGAAADLTLRISQLDINVPLEAEAFAYDVPKDWAPLTLEELRRAGPLGGESK
jgi:outer membrane lipoprotein-sorting protein